MYYTSIFNLGTKIQEVQVFLIVNLHFLFVNSVNNPRKHESECYIHCDARRENRQEQYGTDDNTQIQSNRVVHGSHFRLIFDSFLASKDFGEFFFVNLKKKSPST